MFSFLISSENLKNAFQNCLDFKLLVKKKRKEISKYQFPIKANLTLL